MRATTIAFSALALLTPALANVNLASVPFNKLFARADVECAGSDIACGDTCIPSTYTCCPDNLGGCSADENCQMGDNDEYGCCPEGEVCTGDGGAEFIDEKAAAEASTGKSEDSVSDAPSSAHAFKATGSFVVAVAAVAALL